MLKKRSHPRRGYYAASQQPGSTGARATTVVPRLPLPPTPASHIRVQVQVLAVLLSVQLMSANAQAQQHMSQVLGPLTHVGTQMQSGFLPAPCGHLRSGPGHERSLFLESVWWFSWLFLCLQVLSSHMGTNLCSHYSTSNPAPCSRPGKAVENEPIPWTLHQHG